MGRSVSTPSGAVAVSYTTFEYEGNDDDGYFAQCEFDECVDFLTGELKSAFPSLYEDEKWVGREDRAFLANRFARIGLSEYCGLVAVWVVAKDDSPLGEAWGAKIANKLQEITGSAFGKSLVKVGTFSNGESVFQSV